MAEETDSWSLGPYAGFDIPSLDNGDIAQSETKWNRVADAAVGAAGNIISAAGIAVANRLAPNPGYAPPISSGQAEVSGGFGVTSRGMQMLLLGLAIYYLAKKG